MNRFSSVQLYVLHVELPLAIGIGDYVYKLTGSSYLMEIWGSLFVYRECFVTYRNATSYYMP